MEVFLIPEFTLFVSVLLFLMFNLTFEIKGTKFHFGKITNKLIVLWIEYTVYILIWYFLMLTINDGVNMDDLSLSYLQNEFSIFSKTFLCLLFFFFLITIRWFLAEEDLFYKGQELFFFLWMMFLGFIMMFSCKNFMLLFLSLECQAFAMYILIALHYKNRLATEAAMKYFLFGALSVLLFLISICFLYYLLGSLDLEVIRTLSFTTVENFSFLEKCMLHVAVVLLCCSFLLKLGSVPFHFWMPDVYNGAPFMVMFLFFLLPKVGLVLYMLYLFPVVLEVFYEIWSPIFFYSGIFSVFVGSILTLDQWKFRRLLVYSSIVNMGYILLALSASNSEVFSISVFYLISYLINIAVIFLIILFSMQSKIYVIRLQDFFGFIKLYPILGFCLIIALFVSGGLPPFLLFYPKINIIAQLIGGNVFSFFTLIILILLTVISVFYYIRVIRYFITLNSERNFLSFSNSHVRVNTYFFHYLIILLTLLQVLFIFLGDELLLLLFHNIVF